jgi:hypothetical protein
MKPQDNEETKQSDNMELLKQQAESGGCGSSCACHSSGSSGKARWMISAVILIAAGVLVVKAMNKPNGTTDQAAAGTFSLPVPNTTPAMDKTAPAESTPAESAHNTAQSDEMSVGTTIGLFSELNTVAVGSDAVFIYLPGKEVTSATAPAAAMQAAAKSIESSGGAKCALFTLKAGSLDYDAMAGKITTPGVLALVKGKGINAVSGEVTESKLVQSFVAASSAGGCGPSGCGPSSGGCN